jgi:hypothetical protein
MMTANQVEGGQRDRGGLPSMPERAIVTEIAWPARVKRLGASMTELGRVLMAVFLFARVVVRTRERASSRRRAAP